MVGHVLLKCFAALAVLGSLGLVLSVAGVAALGVGLDVDPVLGVAGVAALGVGLDVDPVLGVAGVAALGIGPLLDVAGVAAVAVDFPVGLVRVMLKSLADLAIAAFAAGRTLGCDGAALMRWWLGHVSHPPVRRRKGLPYRLLTDGTSPSKSRQRLVPRRCWPTRRGSVSNRSDPKSKC